MSQPWNFFLKLTILAVAGIATQACSDIAKDHDRKCRESIKLIIHDEGLWRQYRLQSQIAHRHEMSLNPPNTGRTYWMGVGDFKMRFGEKKTLFRSTVDGKIVRDDLFILKNDKVVAQMVDYTALQKGFDGPTGYDCIGYYKGMEVSD